MANTKITNPELFNLGDSTSATQLPVMTTTERIAITPTVTTFNVDYLVVAGGGGGGMGYYGGGGGAGGLLTNVGGTSLVLATGGSGYTITVGDGGSAATSKTVNGTNGSDSQFNAIVANGGGGGGSRNTTGGSSGGSGGGSANPGNAGGSGTVGQGSNGGTLTGERYGSGGGGANQAGQIPPQTYYQTPQNYSIGAPGGNGLEVNIIGGTGNYYAGGGGGGARATYSPNGIDGGLGGGGAGGAFLPGSNGIDNTGGGGGAGGDDNDSGGRGGSGVVILRYPTADIASYVTTGLTPTKTTDGADTILSFTTVGTGTIAFTSASEISVGEMIFNSTTDKVEYWDGTKWYGITYEAQELSPTDPFGDGSQTALYKFAGNGNNENGTYTASVTASYITGILGGGVSLGGSASSLVTSMQPLSLGQSKTLWINFDSINFNTDKQFYFTGGESNIYDFWSLALYYQASTGLFYIGQSIRNQSNSYWYTGTGYTLNNVSKTDWNLIYVSYSAGNFKYSINNSTIATNPKTISSGSVFQMSANHEFGRMYSNGTPYYTESGTKISSMRQFNRELVQSEIQQIYDQVY